MVHQDPDAELAEATGDLYRLDPGDFVPARNELARRLRQAGNRDLAGRVAKLRRPSPAAWAVNQLARRHRADLDGLLRLGEALRTAQTATLAGADAAGLRQAGRARRDAVARLADLAVGLLAERGAGAGAHHVEVVASLEAASLDPQAAEEVGSGRMTSSLERPSWFGELGIDLSDPAEEHDLPPSVAEGGPPEPSPVLAEAAERLTRAKRAAAETAATAKARSAEARDLAGLAEQRRLEVDGAEAEMARGQRRLDDARRSAEVGARRADEARRAAALAEAAAASAAERLRDTAQAVEGRSSR